MHAWQKGHANAERRIDVYIRLITVCEHGLDIQYTTAGFENEKCASSAQRYGKTFGAKIKVYLSHSLVEGFT